MRGLEDCSEVVVRWFRLEEVDRSIGQFQAHTVPIVSLMQGDGDKKFWPPPRRRAPLYRPRPANEGDVQAIEAGPDAGAEDMEPSDAEAGGQEAEPPMLEDGLEEGLAELLAKP